MIKNGTYEIGSSQLTYDLIERILREKVKLTKTELPYTV